MYEKNYFWNVESFTPMLELFLSADYPSRKASVSFVVRDKVGLGKPRYSYRMEIDTCAAVEKYIRNWIYIQRILFAKCAY